MLTPEDVKTIRSIVHEIVNEAMVAFAKTTADLIESVIEDKLEPIRNDIQEIKEDIIILKKDVAMLKNDVSILKKDVALLKKDVAVLKKDVAILKKDVRQLKNDVSFLKQDSENFKSYMHQNYLSLNNRMRVLEEKDDIDLIHDSDD